MFCRRTTSPRSAPRRTTQVLVALTMGAGVVAATPGAAQARTVTDADEVKDMARVGAEEGTFSPAPRHRINDIESTRLTHTSSKVEVVLTLARLQKTGSLSWHVTIEPSKGEGARELDLQASQGGWSGMLSVRDPETDESVGCGQHDIDYVNDVVRIKLPRDCVGDGRWVRFRVGAVSRTESADYGDDALRDRPLKDSDNNWAWSDPVYR